MLTNRQQPYCMPNSLQCPSHDIAGKLGRAPHTCQCGDRGWEGDQGLTACEIEGGKCSQGADRLWQGLQAVTPLQVQLHQVLQLSQRRRQCCQCTTECQLQPGTCPCTVRAPDYTANTWHKDKWKATATACTMTMCAGYMQGARACIEACTSLQAAMHDAAAPRHV